MVEKKPFLIAALLALASSPVLAQSYTDVRYGNGFLTACQSTDVTVNLTCTVYAAGLADMSEGVFSSYCAPATATLGQKKDMVLKVLRERPEIRHLLTAIMWRATMEAAFPCATPKK